eukprot:494074_1
MIFATHQECESYGFRRQQRRLFIVCNDGFREQTQYTLYETRRIVAYVINTGKAVFKGQHNVEYAIYFDHLDETKVQRHDEEEEKDVKDENANGVGEEHCANMRYRCINFKWFNWYSIHGWE